MAFTLPPPDLSSNRQNVPAREVAHDQAKMCLGSRQMKCEVQPEWSSTRMSEPSGAAVNMRVRQSCGPRGAQRWRNSKRLESGLTSR